MDMTELMERLCYMLNLPLTTTPEEMKAELDKLKTMLTSNPAAAAAMIVGLGPHVAALTAQGAPDPAKFVPVAVVEALQTKVADLSARLDGDEVERLVQSGLSDGRLLPELEAWARDLGKANKAALSAYLDKQRPIAALSGKQTGGRTPPGKTTADPAEPLEARCTAEWNADAALRAEFGDNLQFYIAYKDAAETGAIKIMGAKE